MNEELFEKLEKENNPFRFALACHLATTTLDLQTSTDVHRRFGRKFMRAIAECKRLRKEHPTAFADDISPEIQDANWELLQSGLLSFFEILEKHPEHLE